jgi:hypothetical protein
MSDGFFNRWSRRKLDAGQGKPPANPPPAIVATADEPAVAPLPHDAASEPAVSEAAEAPPPTLEEVQVLTPDSDFSRFVARGVEPDIKNAALKKLFADPRYNVMDGLDVYLDDFSRPQPLAPALLRQLAGAEFLGLFKDEQNAQALRHGREVSDDSPNQSVAHCDRASSAASQPSHHADPDLRLQQDHADPGADPGHGTG